MLFSSKFLIKWKVLLEARERQRPQDPACGTGSRRSGRGGGGVRARVRGSAGAPPGSLQLEVPRRGGRERAEGSDVGSTLPWVPLVNLRNTAFGVEFGAEEPSRSNKGSREKCKQAPGPGSGPRLPCLGGWGGDRGLWMARCLGVRLWLVPLWREGEPLGPRRGSCPVGERRGGFSVSEGSAGWLGFGPS